jgi:hypothetical protein
MSSHQSSFLIPTNRDVGASRVNGRSLPLNLKTPVEASPSLQARTLAFISVVIPWAFFRNRQRLLSSRNSVSGVPGKLRPILSSRVLTAISFHLRRAVQGHHEHPHGREWMDITAHVNPLLAELLGTEIFTAACAWPNASSGLGQRCPRD